MKYYKILSLVAGICLLSNCSDPDMGTPAPSTSVKTAKLLFINAAPDASSPALLVNNSQLTAPAFPGSSGIKDILTSNQQYRVKNVVYGVNGQDTVAMGADLSLVSSIAADASYTLILTDTVKRPFSKTSFSTAPGGLQFLNITDVLTAPTAGNTGIRFLNLAPGAPLVFLTASGNSIGTLSGTGRGYRSTTGFTTFTSFAAGTYDLEVRTGNATGPIIATLPAQALGDGKLYTVYLTGKKVGSIVKVPYAVNAAQHN